MSRTSIAAEDELTFKRDLFGQNALPIWSPLTNFEKNTLDHILNAQQGDANALLAFYILAAGSHRDQQSYLRIQQQLDTWLATLHQPLQRKRKLVDKAKLLHDAMHNRFFLQDDDGDTMIGYDADQSRLPEIFSSQHFNCISSSLLYLVLARKLSMPVEGVLLPSHTFVQLQTDSGSPIEIETTSIHGFATHHDEAFYQHDDISWFEQRNLQPTTYQDYLQREILTPYQLGLHNMWSQHTSPDRMPYQDRMRLAEIRAYLLPEDLDAQKNRLNYYFQELAYLNREKDFATANQLSNLIADYLTQIASFAQQDAVLQSLFFNVQIEIALTKLYGNELTQGFALAKELLQEFDRQPDLEPHFHNNLMVVFSHYILQAMKHQDFADVRISLIGLEPTCVASEACSQSLTQFYALWAQQFWQQNQWETVSRILTEYANFGIDSDNSKILRTNAETAYVNQAKELVWDGDWEAALARLQTCTDNISGQVRCTAEIQSINKQRHLGNL